MSLQYSVSFLVLKGWSSLFIRTGSGNTNPNGDGEWIPGADEWISEAGGDGGSKAKAPRRSTRGSSGGSRPKGKRKENATSGDAGLTKAVAPIQEPKERPDANHHLKFTYGVNAWKHWVVLKNQELEAARQAGTSYTKNFETDILRMRADELAFTLCLFVKEVKKPNGDSYAPDSIVYLTLGIQE
jgi:hypothetical protein